MSDAMSFCGGLWSSRAGCTESAKHPVPMNAVGKVVGALVTTREPGGLCGQRERGDTDAEAHGVRAGDGAIEPCGVARVRTSVASASRDAKRRAR